MGWKRRRSDVGGAKIHISEFLTHDGLTLVGEHHRLAEAKASLVIVHGFGEHRRRYKGLLAQLLDRGYECHLFDLRGHGDSGGRRGHVAEFSDYLEDLALFATRASEFSSIPAGPIAETVLLGHSLGGLIALQAVLHQKVDFSALALSSPFLSSALSVPPGANALVRGLSRLVPWLAVKAPIDPDLLSHDSDVVAAYRQDPLIVRKLTLSWAAESVRAQEEILQRAGEINLPSLFLVAGADEIADPARSRQVFERLGSTDKQIEVYSGLRHEILNELGRDEVVADLIGWLDHRCE